MCIIYSNEYICMIPLEIEMPTIDVVEKSYVGGRDNVSGFWFKWFPHTIQSASLHPRIRIEKIPYLVPFDQGNSSMGDAHDSIAL